MNDGWIKIFTTQEVFKARVLEAKLQENGIECYIMNKQDSAYLMFGNLTIYTKAAEVERAKKLILEIED